MDDLKLTLKPSAEVVQKAAAEYTVTDSTGRAIKLKKPGVLAQFRLVEIMGEAAKNQVYMGMVLPLIYVTEIDGQMVPPPSSKLEVEALIQQLDEHGCDAVMAGVQAHFGAVDPDKDKATLKKS